MGDGWIHEDAIIACFPEDIGNDWIEAFHTLIELGFDCILFKEKNSFSYDHFRVGYKNAEITIDDDYDFEDLAERQIMAAKSFNA